jgi:hypothetical protein
MACFIGFVLCSVVAAYTPMFTLWEGPPCKSAVVEETTVSGNTLDTVMFTGEKKHSPMLPNHSQLAKCPVCSGLFWVASAAELEGSIDANKKGQKVLPPSEKDLLDYLARPECPKEREPYLRLRAWWTANDQWRWHPNPKPAFPSEEMKNLQTMSEMLTESKPSHRILKAEIAREMERSSSACGFCPISSTMIMGL